MMTSFRCLFVVNEEPLWEWYVGLIMGPREGRGTVTLQYVRTRKVLFLSSKPY